VHATVPTLRTCSRSTGACPTRYAGWAGDTTSRSSASGHGFGAVVGCGAGWRLVGAGAVPDPPAADPPAADPLAADPSPSAARPGSLVAGDAVSPPGFTEGSAESDPVAGALGLGEPTAAARSPPPSPPPGRIAQNSSSTPTTAANATARRRQ